jgi:hypothetical protein
VKKIKMPLPQLNMAHSVRRVSMGKKVIDPEVDKGKCIYIYTAVDI